MNKLLSFFIAASFLVSGVALAEDEMGKMKMPPAAPPTAQATDAQEPTARDPNLHKDSGASARTDKACEQCVQMSGMTFKSCCTESGACCKKSAKAAGRSKRLSKHKGKVARPADPADAPAQKPSGMSDSMPMDEGEMGGMPKDPGQGMKPGGMQMGPGQMGHSGDRDGMKMDPNQMGGKQMGKGHKKAPHKKAHAPDGQQEPAQAPPADPPMAKPMPMEDDGEM